MTNAMIDRDRAIKLTKGIFQGIYASLSADGISSTESRLISNYEESRNELVGKGLGELWEKLMSELNAYAPERPLLVSEKALACIIRRGADKKNIRMNGTKARVFLNNATYYVEKEGAGCSAGIFGYSGYWSRLPMRWITLSGEEFADFMFEFDELITESIKEFDVRMQEYQIKCKQFEILCTATDQLGEIYLKPYGIMWQNLTRFTENAAYVMFSDDEHKPIYEDIPLDKMADIFESIPDRMKKQPPIPKRKRDYFLW